MIRRLAVVRQQRAQIKEARDQVRYHVNMAYANGTRDVAGTGYKLKATDPGEPVTVRKVETHTVKKADPKAWERARAVVSYVQVKPPAAFKLAVPLVPTPSVPANHMPIDKAVVLLKEDRAWAVSRELRDEEVELVERLEKLAADFGWDGLPITFADGWTAGLRRLQFSSDKLAELDPALFDQLAVERTQQRPGYVRVVKADDDMDPWDELDGE